MRDDGGTSGDDHLAGFDLVEGNGDQIGTQREALVSGRDDGDGGAVGDGLRLVVVGPGKGEPERGGMAVRAGSSRQKVERTMRHANRTIMVVADRR